MSYHNLYSALPTIVLAACLIVPSADTVADPNLARLGGNDNAHSHAGLTAANGAVHGTSSPGDGSASRGGRSSDSTLNGPQSPTGASDSDDARPVGGLATADDRPYRTTDGPVPGSDDPPGAGMTTDDSRSPAGDNSGRDLANPVGGLAAAGAPYGTTRGTVSESDDTPDAGMPTGTSRTPAGNNGGSNGANPAGGLAAAGTPAGTTDGPTPGSNGTPGAGTPTGTSTTPAGNNGGSNGDNPAGGLAATGTPADTTDGPTPGSNGAPGAGTPTGAPQTPTGDSGPDSVISPAVVDVGPDPTVVPGAGQGEQGALLAPDPPSPTGVPEPGSWLMLTVGLAMIAGLSRQRRRPH